MARASALEVPFAARPVRCAPAFGSTGTGCSVLGSSTGTGIALAS
jgi:hypothetical protein